MALITKEDIAELSEIKKENCISIFIPTHRAGEKVLEGVDSLRLKNELAEVREKLAGKGLQPREIEQLIVPAQQLVEDTSFWRVRSDGLAIFLADGFSKIYTVPVYFKEFNYVSDSFYLKPLMPLFVGDGEFYLLMLERSNVKLYQCTRHSFTEIDIEECIPETKQDVVGHDYEQKNLQFRTGQGAPQGGAIYHGQEAATGKRKNEIKKYLRAINDGIVPLIREDDRPMVVAALDPLFDIYKEVNTYPHLVEENIRVNFGDTDIYEAHEVAWEAIAPVFDQKRKDKIALFLAEQGTGKTAIGINEIVPAAFHGKIDTLFCENKEEILATIKKKVG